MYIYVYLYTIPSTNEESLLKKLNFLFYNPQALVIIQIMNGYESIVRIFSWVENYN